MKKIITYAFILSIIISSCGTHAAQGAYTGSQVGSVLGSAIGGLSNGWRGRDVGTIAGMVGGAVVGGAIGNACDKAKEKKSVKKNYDDAYDDNYQYNDDNYEYRNNDYNNNVKFGSSSHRAHQAELRNIIFYDADDNGILSPDENAEVVFEIYNRSGSTLYDVVPVVEQVSKLKHIQISRSQKINMIEPGKTMRYTAYIRTDRKLKNGIAEFRISVCNTSDKIIAPITQFKVETKR